MLVASLRWQTGLHVIGIVMTHRTDDRQLIGDLGTLGEQFAELNARDPGADGAKFTAHLCRPGRLGVKGFLLRVTAMKKEHDHPLGTAKGSRLAARCLVTCL
jgi:hypothetical protein